jgi:hypothetical protein
MNEVPIEKPEGEQEPAEGADEEP